VVEYLPSMCKALSLSPRTTNNNNKHKNINMLDKNMCQFLSLPGIKFIDSLFIRDYFYFMPATFMLNLLTLGKR
jgi:hypothetical protein